MTRYELVNKLIELGYGDCQVKPDLDVEDPDDSYEIWVPRARFAAAKSDIGLGKLGIYASVHQKTPTLIPANPGQWVRIYSEYESEDARSPIGIVTSRRTLDDQTVYGCSYLQASLGNQYLSNVYTFHLSSENYGGWHAGFLAVMSEGEVQTALEQLIDEKADEVITATKLRQRRDKDQVPELLAHIATGKAGAAVIWHPPAEPSSVSVQIQIPPVYFRK